MEQITEILNAIKEAIPWLAVGSVVIEVIPPIKLKPWSWVAKKIGKAINSEVLDDLKALKKKNNELEAAVENVKFTLAQKDAKDARASILRFGDELIFYPERKYSKDRFDEVAQCITEYDKYCEKHPEFPNHMTQTTSEMILKEYQRRMEAHEFL